MSQLQLQVPVIRVGGLEIGPDYVFSTGKRLEGGPYRRAKDAKRDTWLTSHGWTVLRFENREALAHPERVLAAIDENGGLKWG